MNFIKTYRWLLPSLAFTLLLILVRVCYTGHALFVFMPWNLFLAAVPLYMTYRMEHTQSLRHQWMLAALWLLFFPNAMYIVTDLFHLRNRGDVPLWYDLLLLLSAAISGCVMGFVSLYQMERWVQRFTSRRMASVIVFALLLLCGYGVYLGRYERWNSWDVIVNPLELLRSMAYHILHPLRNKDIWALTLAFGVWLYLLYQYLPRLSISIKEKADKLPAEE